MNYIELGQPPRMALIRSQHALRHGALSPTAQAVRVCSWPMRQCREGTWMYTIILPPKMVRATTGDRYTDPKTLDGVETIGP